MGEADSVWVVSRITRACNDKTARSLLPTPLRDALMGDARCCPPHGGGYLGALCVVANQADLLTPSEIEANLGMPAGSSARACAEARNAYTKSELTARWCRDLPPRRLPVHRPPAASWEDARMELPVFTVSSTEYQKLVGMRDADGGATVFDAAVQTELPALRHFLAFAAAAHHRREARRAGVRRAGDAEAREAGAPVGAMLLDCLNHGSLERAREARAQAAAEAVEAARRVAEAERRREVEAVAAAEAAERAAETERRRTAAEVRAAEVRAAAREVEARAAARAAPMLTRIIMLRRVGAMAGEKVALPASVAELLELARKELDLTSPARRVFSEQGDEYDMEDLVKHGVQCVGVDRVLYVSCGENFAPPVALAAPHTSLAAATLAPGPAASVNLGEAGGTCPTKTTRVTTRVTN